MSTSRAILGRRVAVSAVVISTSAVFVGLAHNPASADVTAVAGSAYGYFAS